METEKLHNQEKLTVIKKEVHQRVQLLCSEIERIKNDLPRDQE